MSPAFHSSIEGAQHGAKSLQQFLDFAKQAGAAGVQPSNFMLQEPDGTLMSSQKVKKMFADAEMKLDGISAHCPFWVLGSAWTESKTILPFIPDAWRGESAAKIEQLATDYLLGLMDLSVELGNRIIPMFWGLSYGLEVGSGYPWGLWAGPGYDLIAEGDERFVKQTERLLYRAGNLGIALAHEIHPGTAAMCADDFLHLLKITDQHPALMVNADPSHCWEGESVDQRFLKVGPYIAACHIKDHKVRGGHALRSMQSDWRKRGMQFTMLGDGDIDLVAFVKLLVQVGYIERYREYQVGSTTVPLVGEAEDAFVDLDCTAKDAIRYINNMLCLTLAQGSFEDGLGA